MDVLHSIPEELWRAIFGMISVPWIYGADLSSDPLRLFRSHQMDVERVKDTQSNRMALMLVCKAMLPLAEELLYSEVYINTPRAADGFFEAARSTQDRLVSPGWWTRRISIDTVGWNASSVARIFETLEEACPNITCLHTEQDPWSTITLYTALLRVLRTLTLTGITLKAEDLPEIANNCPHLIHLHLFPSTAFYGHLQSTTFPNLRPTSLTFPNLRRLSISSHLIQDMVNTMIKFSFPLEWLSIKITSADAIPAIHQFCHQYGPKLVGLELYADVGKYTWSPVILPFDFLDFGRNLRTVVVSPSLDLEFSEGQEFPPMESLNEVVLRVDVYHSMFSAGAFADYFAPSRFPHVRHITLSVLHAFRLEDRPAMCESIGKLLPDVQVEMRTDYA